MFRLILLLAVLALPAPGRAAVPDAPPLHPSPNFTLAGPAAARGAVVWLHGSYDAAHFPVPPPAQAWVGRLARRGYDVWRFDRVPHQDPLDSGYAGLTRGLGELRAAGYRRVVVAGYSRGGFIGLSALDHPGLADAVAAVSPAAHGTSPQRRQQAMAAWRALMDGAVGATPLALVVLRDDPFDPDPDGRIAIARAAIARTGARLLLVDRPPQPRGHEGSETTQFDSLFGACLAEFLDGGAARECTPGQP
jgi:hypothetical protein